MWLIRLFRRSDNLTEEEAYEHGFHELPLRSKRASMSPERLAILLSELETGTPAHILVEHELQLRIAKVQSQATREAAIFGLAGVLLGALITVAGQWLLQLSEQAKSRHEPASATATPAQMKSAPQSPATSASASKPTASAPRQ